MPLQSSGRIKLSEIAAQFGGSGPHLLSEYAKGGSNVKTTTVNANIGTSGNPIKFTQFYSTGNPVFNKLVDITNTSSTCINQTVTLNTAERGENTNIVVMASSRSGSKSKITHTLTITNPSKTDIVLANIGNQNSDDGQGCFIGTFKAGDIATFDCNLTRSHSGRGGIYQVWQIDNAFDSESSTNRQTFAPDGNVTSDVSFASTNNTGCSFVAYCADDGHSIGTIANVDVQSGDSRKKLGVDYETTGAGVTYTDSGSHSVPAGAHFQL
jgi:hypothetical protein